MGHMDNYNYTKGIFKKHKKLFKPIGKACNKTNFLM